MISPAAAGPSERGHNAEQILERLFHAAARAARVADIWKVSTPTVWAKNKLIYAKPSVTDYVGILLDGSGRFIAEEAKSTENDVFYLSAVKPHQRGFLDRTLAANGIALLTVIGQQGVWSFRWRSLREATSITLRAHMDDFVTPDSYVRRLRGS